MLALTYRPLIHLPRRADRTIFPAAVAGALAFAILLQIALPHGFDLPEPGVLRPFAVGEAVPAPIVADRAITERSPFDPLRGGTPASPGAAPTARPLGGVIAAGLARRGGLTVAFVQAPDGSVTQLALGGLYRGWRLVRAGPAGLDFRRGGENLTLPFTAPPPGAALPPAGAPR